jgi:hypothetical protein
MSVQESTATQCLVCGKEVDRPKSSAPQAKYHDPCLASLHAASQDLLDACRAAYSFFDGVPEFRHELLIKKAIDKAMGRHSHSVAAEAV